jgi:excisionase family DNA binding protein
VNQRPKETDALMTPGEVAAMYGVDPRTVARWAKAGKVTAVRTLGGHRRFYRSEVLALRENLFPDQRNGTEG